MTDSPYRILMVLDNLGAGGTETYVISLSKPLQQKGAQLFYAGADGPFHQTFVEAGFQIHLVQSSVEPLAARNQQLQQAYKKVMIGERITIVHVHQTPSGMNAARAAKELGIPVVFTMHGTYYPPEEAKQLAKLSTQVISVSKPVQRYWEKRLIDSVVISNGVDFEEYRLDKEEQTTEALLEIPQNATVVTYVSRLAWQKASVCNMVLKASKHVQDDIKDLHLIVVGSGPQANHVNDLANMLNKQKGQTYIHVVGEKTDVLPYYRISDLVIGTGRVALEAMACGKPVLAIGNHGYLGLVTPAMYNLAWEYYFGDHFSIEKPTPVMIAEALKQAFANREQLQKAGEIGKVWAYSMFDIEQKTEMLLKVYRQVRKLG